MADSPAMPVLLHQLPDGDTIGQQWAELPPVLGATQMVGAEGAEKKEKKRARRKAQRKESFAARRGQRSGCLSSGHPSISDLSNKSDLLSEMRSGHSLVALPLRRERGNAFALGAQGRQNYEVPGHWVLLDQVSQVTPPCDPLNAARPCRNGQAKCSACGCSPPLSSAFSFQLTADDRRTEDWLPPQLGSVHLLLQGSSAVAVACLAGSAVKGIAAVGTALPPLLGGGEEGGRGGRGKKKNAKKASRRASK